ncbi:hypothetical protein GA0061081_102139 [Gilliamella bombicola]|uniref:Uncharacterized protein n=1 Tax=Gilliamella bombicola TaxID=1798182 RepID=A0A1C3ZXC7_9GAMM|nr:hypothetical protein GA0061081_102139 [Gilliamella bombicola]
MPLIDIYYTNNNFESKRKIIADTVYSSLPSNFGILVIAITLFLSKLQ